MSETIRPHEAEGDWHSVSDRGGSVVWMPWRTDAPSGPYLHVADRRAGVILAATLNACEAYPIADGTIGPC